MSEDNNSNNPPTSNPLPVWNFDNVEPIPARVTTGGYKPSQKELEQILNEQKK